MDLKLLLCLKYVSCHDQYETRLNFYKPLYYATNKLKFPTRASTLLCLFSLFKGVKSLYLTYLIVNFTALNLQGITLLHLLTTRVGLHSLLKSVRLFLLTTGVAYSL